MRRWCEVPSVVQALDRCSTSVNEPPPKAFPSRPGVRMKILRDAMPVSSEQTRIPAWPPRRDGCCSVPRHHALEVTGAVPYHPYSRPGNRPSHGWWQTCFLGAICRNYHQCLLRSNGSCIYWCEGAWVGSGVCWGVGGPDWPKARVALGHRDIPEHGLRAAMHDLICLTLTRKGGCSISDL